MSNKKDGKVLLAALTGVASGFVLGVLFAPDKGEKTRSKINDKRDEYLKELTKEVEHLRENLRDQAEKTKADLDDFSDGAKQKRDNLIARAKKLTSYDEWTKQELYEHAKKAGIDGYSSMNKAELIEALRDK